MLFIFVSVISMFSLPVFFVIAVCGVFKKNKRLKRIGGFGCVGAVLVFALGMVLTAIYSDTLREDLIDNQKQGIENIENATEYYKNK